MQRQLPAVLRLLRMRSGLTGRQFAPRLGKCNSWVSKIESGAISITAIDFFSWLIASGNTISMAVQLMRDEGIPVSGFALTGEYADQQSAGTNDEDLIGQLRLLAQMCQQKHIGLNILPNGEFKIRHKADR